MTSEQLMHAMATQFLPQPALAHPFLLPLDHQNQGSPFEVLTQLDGVACVVLSDQVKSLDWGIRRAKQKAVVPAEVLLHVRAKMKALLQIK